MCSAFLMEKLFLRSKERHYFFLQTEIITGAAPCRNERKFEEFAVVPEKKKHTCS